MQFPSQGTCNLASALHATQPPRPSAEKRKHFCPLSLSSTSASRVGSLTSHRHNAELPTQRASERGAKVSRSKESPSEVMAARIISPEGRRRTEAAATVISTEVSYAVQVMPKYKGKIEPRGHDGRMAVKWRGGHYYVPTTRRAPRQRQVPFRSWFNI